MTRLRGRELAAYILLSALWSGNWLVIKVGLQSLPPLRFAGLRLVLACLLLGPIVVLRRRPGVTAREMCFVALVGFLQIGVSSGLAPLATGGLLMLMSSLVLAFSVVLIKKHLALISPVVNVLGQSIVAALFLLPAAAVFERSVVSHWTPSSVGALLYLGVIGTFTFVGTQWLVPRVPAAVVGSFPLINTLLALLWGSLLADEKLSGHVFVGGTLILAGVVLVTLVSPRGMAPTAQAVPESVKL